jgi:hypothetical protein
MWSNIVGSCFLVSGVLFAINPERLRRRLRRKGVRTLRRYLFAAALASGALLISLGREYEGLLPVLFIGAGVIMILKAVFLLKAKSAQLIAERLLEVPALYLRLYAVAQMAVGAAILWLPKAQSVVE